MSEEDTGSMVVDSVADSQESPATTNVIIHCRMNLMNIGGSKDLLPDEINALIEGNQQSPARIGDAGDIKNVLDNINRNLKDKTYKVSFKTVGI